MARILILTYGTRGDVEPFVALSLGLQKAGHEVTLATAEQFQSWVTSFGLPYAPITNASLDAIYSEDGKTMLEGGTRLFSRVAAGIRLSRQAGPINADLCRDAWLAAEATQPELILYHPKLIAGPHIAEALKIPAILALLQPMFVPTSAFPATGLPRLRLPGYNRMSYALVGLSYRAFKKTVNAFRTETLGLPRLTSAGKILMPADPGEIKVLHAMSPSVITRPDDWPGWAHMTGYWSLAPDPAYEPPEALARFLEAGDPPVYVGFGSMISKDAKALGQIVVDTLQIAGVRGVLGAGWAGLSETRDRIITVRDVPHGWLFPRMAAVVHHGGAGTTAAGFRAGIPSVICPFFGDQPGWAEISTTLGVGATPVRRKDLTAERLARSIREALDRESIRQNAQSLAETLDAEDGLGTAIAEIEACLS